VGATFATSSVHDVHTTTTQALATNATSLALRSTRNIKKGTVLMVQHVSTGATGGTRPIALTVTRVTAERVFFASYTGATFPSGSFVCTACEFMLSMTDTLEDGSTQTESLGPISLSDTCKGKYLTDVAGSGLDFVVGASFAETAAELASNAESIELDDADDIDVGEWCKIAGPNDTATAPSRTAANLGTYNLAEDDTLVATSDAGPTTLTFRTKARASVLGVGPSWSVTFDGTHKVLSITITGYSAQTVTFVEAATTVASAAQQINDVLEGGRARVVGVNSSSSRMPRAPGTRSRSLATGTSTRSAPPRPLRLASETWSTSTPLRWSRWWHSRTPRSTAGLRPAPSRTRVATRRSRATRPAALPRWSSRATRVQSSASRPDRSRAKTLRPRPSSSR